MAYVGNQPVPQATQTRDRFVATSGQTSFATSGYTPNFVDVYLDGVKLDSSEYTATNGSDVVLASGASTGQIMEVVAFSSFDVADIRNMTQPLGLKNYTTTERNALTGIGAGDTIFNSTVGSIQFYDGTNWLTTNLIPSINSVTGNIYEGASSSLTISIANATSLIDVKYYEGATLLATDTDVTVTGGSATSTVPAAVYTQTAGDTISIEITNEDGTPSSNSISKTVIGAPTGGSITSSGSYRIHTFTSSGTFVVPSGLTLSDVEYLVIAGGGSGGDGTAGGGGGAGGYRSSIASESSGGGGSTESKLTLTAGSKTITVGAGGSAPTGTSNQQGNDGSNSVFDTITSIAGGGGGGENTTAIHTGRSGGSGGGACFASTGGSGTSNQGYAGGNGYVAGPPWLGGGGGGASAAGQNGNAVTNYAGNGGDGIASSATGSSITRAGGGGGASQGTGTTNGAGGAGGGGAGADDDSGSGNVNGVDATVNTGSGGGGGPNNTGNRGGNGGSGIVIVRYQL